MRSLLCVRASVELTLSSRFGLWAARNATYATSSFWGVENLCPESPPHCSAGLYTYNRSDHCRKLHMQCKATASDGDVR